MKKTLTLYIEEQNFFKNKGSFGIDNELEFEKHLEGLHKKIEDKFWYGKINKKNK